MTLEEKNRLLATIPTDEPQQEKPYVDTRDDTSRLVENIGTFGYDALNSVLMGLPDAVINSVGGSEAKKRIDALRARNKDASTIGEIGGLVGSMFIPGGAIVKGLGAGAKAIGATKAAGALGKAANWMKGGQLTGNLAQKAGQAALRGGAQAAEQVIPRTIISQLDAGKTDEEKQAELANAPLSVLMGAGIGGVLGPAAQKLLGKGTKAIGEYGDDLGTYGATKARELLDKATLATTGIETRALRNAAKSLGLQTASSAARHGEDYVSELAAGIRKYGIRGERQWEALLDKNDEAWKAIDKGFAKNAPKDWNQVIAQNIANDDDIINRAINTGEQSGLQMVDEATKMMAGNSSLKSIRETLGNIARNNMTGTPAERAKAQVAMAIKKKFDDFVADASGENVTEAKEMYKLLQPFMIQESRDAFKIGKLFNAGSPTFEKAELTKLAGGAGAGAFASGEIQNIGQEDFDPTRLITGSLLGGVAPKVLTKVLNKGVDELGRIGGNILARPENAQALAKIITTTPGKVPKAAALLQQEAAKNPDPAKTIAEKEVTMSPEKVGQAKQEFTQKFATTINDKLRKIYNQYYQDMDPEDFIARVTQKTGNFTDMNAMAEILYPGEKERKDFLRRYDTYLTLKNVDIDKATQAPGFLEAIPGIGEDKKQARATLVDALVKLKGEDDMTKIRTARKTVEKDLKDLQNNPDLLPSFMNTYGLGFEDLQELGLAGGA